MLRQFAKRVYWRIPLLVAGIGFRNKCAILAAYVVQLSLKMRGRIHESVDKEMSTAAAFLRNTRIQLGETRISIIDWESLLMFASFYETFMPLWFTPGPGDVVLDIGAHIGKHTIHAAKMVGAQGRVIAIEPNRRNYEVLVRNIRLNSLTNIIALNIAAWNANCDLELFIGVTSARHSPKRDQHLGVILVKGRPVDQVLAELGVTTVAWVKIDVEGAEIEVLSGLDETIWRFRPRIIAEVAHENIPSIKTFAEKAHYGLVAISSSSDQAYFFLTPL